MKKLAAVALTVGVATASCSGGHGGSAVLPPFGGAKPQANARAARCRRAGGLGEHRDPGLELDQRERPGGRSRPRSRSPCGSAAAPQRAAAPGGDRGRPDDRAGPVRRDLRPDGGRGGAGDGLPAEPGLEQRHRRAQPPARQRHRQGGPGRRGLRHHLARLHAERRERLRQHRPAYVPAALGGTVVAVLGLNDVPAFKPSLHVGPAAGTRPRPAWSPAWRPACAATRRPTTGARTTSAACRRRAASTSRS